MMFGIEKAVVSPRAHSCLGPTIEGDISKPVHIEMGEMDRLEMWGRQDMALNSCLWKGV